MDPKESAVVVIRQVLRLQILRMLNAWYPDFIESDRLSKDIARRVEYPELRKEVAYLQEKGLVQLDGYPTTEFRVRITAHGRDFLEGSIEEKGVAAP